MLPEERNRKPTVDSLASQLPQWTQAKPETDNPTGLREYQQHDPDPLRPIKRPSTGVQPHGGFPSRQRQEIPGHDAATAQLHQSVRGRDDAATGRLPKRLSILLLWKSHLEVSTPPKTDPSTVWLSTLPGY